MIAEAWDFAVTCLCPATRNPGPTTTTTQNLAEHENPKRTFRYTANRCHRNGLPFTPVVFDGHARGWRDSARNLATWISERLSTTSFPTPSDSTLGLAQRISSSLHRDSARVFLRRVRMTALRDALTPLGPDDWWPAWDDGDPDAWSTDFVPLPKRVTTSCYDDDDT